MESIDNMNILSFLMNKLNLKKVWMLMASVESANINATLYILFLKNLEIINSQYVETKICFSLNPLQLL